MVLNSIEKLLEKYDEGLTSLKEEQKLRDYFAKEDIPPHLEVYRPMFTYFSNTQKEMYTKEVSFRRKNTDVYKWLSVAAVAVIMLGMVFNPFAGPTEAEKAEALYAYNQTLQAFGMVSDQLNNGTSKLTAFNDLGDNLNEGMQKAYLINEFTETTNIIYNSNNN